MSKRRFLLFLSLALLSAVLLAACGEAKPPQNSTSAVQTTQTEDAGEHVQDPAAGLTPWGTTLRLSVPEGAVGVSVTRTVVNHLGQELSAEYDVPCSAAGEVTHTPFGGIFAAPCPDGTVYVRYSLVYVGADAPEEVTVHSAFPDLANSDLAELLAAALADGDAKQALSLDAREFDVLADFFDADGKPYRADGEITFRIDAPHEVVTLDGHAALRFTGCPILTGMDADGAHEADFAALPMTLYIQSGEFRYACGVLTAE